MPLFINLIVTMALSFTVSDVRPLTA